MYTETPLTQKAGSGSSTKVRYGAVRGWEEQLELTLV